MNAFFQISASIFFITATIFMVALFVWIIKLRVRLGKLIGKTEEIIEITRTTVGVIGDSVERAIESLETLKRHIFTFETGRRIISETIQFIKSNKKGS